MSSDVSVSAIIFSNPNQQKLYDCICDEIRKSTTVGPARKALMLHRMRTRPKVRELVMDEVMAQAYGCGAITMLAPNPNDPAELTMAIDWDKVLQLIIEYLPQIIQLIIMFF